MKIIIAFFILYFPIAFSQTDPLPNTLTHLMLIGGGGEDPDFSYTIFDESLEKFGEFYQKYQWGKTSITFNGGHGQTEEIIKKNFNLNHSRPFTEEEFEKSLNYFILQMKNNDIKKGEQLLIYIDAHGSLQTDHQLSHSITANNLPIQNNNTDLETQHVNLDKLKTITQLAEEKGIKVAIVDMSCHSGSTLALRNSQTCVISATSPDHLSYRGIDSSFTSQFSKALGKGKNLEDLFLEARKNTVDLSYPMISTSSNDLINEFEYRSISPYLFYNQNRIDKLASYLIKEAKKETSCREVEKFNKLHNLIEQVEFIGKLAMEDNLQSNSQATYFDFNKLKDKLLEYQKLQDKMISDLRDINVEKLNHIEIIHSNKNPKGIRYTIEIPWDELIESDYDQYIIDAKEKVRQKENIFENKEVIKLYTEVKKRQEKIIKENPKLIHYKEIIHQYDRNIQDTWSLASQIATEEKRLYDILYRIQQNKNDTNPCKDFIFKTTIINSIAFHVECSRWIRKLHSHLIGNTNNI